MSHLADFEGENGRPKMTRYSLAALLLTSLPNAAWSQTGHLGECDAALARTTIEYRDSTRYDWRLSTLVAKDNYNEQRASAGASAVVYGIPGGQITMNMPQTGATSTHLITSQ